MSLRAPCLLVLLSVGCSGSPSSSRSTPESSGGTSASGGSGTAAGGSSVSTGGQGAGGSPAGAAGGTTPGGSGGASAGGASGGSGGSAPHVVEACPGMTDENSGVWENVTPPDLNSENWCWPAWNDECPAPGETSSSGKVSTYGTNAVVVDPTNTAIVYLGTSSLGLWKSTDCAATWTHISTGENGDKIDQGRSWSLVIDPMDSQILYTTAGYGMGDVYKSTNGGVDWQPMLTPEVRTVLAGGFVEKISMDPTNHEHLVVSAHGTCTGEYASTGCLAVSTDAGATWSLTKSAASWSEGDGQTMTDANTWFYGALFGALWRTTDAGGSWNIVHNGGTAGFVYTGGDGSFYTCSGNGVIHSADGLSWSNLDGSQQCGGNSNGGEMIEGDGTRIFTSNGNGIAWGQTEPPDDGWYYVASDADPTTWTSLHSPKAMSYGGINIKYDADHQILYSSNYLAGFWRVVIP